MPARAGVAKADAGQHKRNREIDHGRHVESERPTLPEIEPLYHTLDQPKPEGCYFDEEAADYAVEWMESRRHYKGRWAGKRTFLLDWQKNKVIRPLFGWKNADGTRLHRLVYVESPRKSGKALALDTPLPTPDGWTEMGAVEIGDELFDDEGQICRVTAVTEVMHGHPCYRVVFSDGTSIVADAEHVWKVRDQYRSKLRVEETLRTTEEMVPRYRLPGDRFPSFRYTVPDAQPLDLPELLLPIEPYVLGAWLGDGSTNSGSITFGEPFVRDEIERCGYMVGESTTDPSKTDVCTIYGVQVRLRELGVLGNKHIPSLYLRASRLQRLALLQGLMDTDGTISTPKGDASLTTISMRLAADVLELLRSLGLKATVRERRTKIYGRDCGPAWVVMFHPFDDLPVFRMPRKYARQQARPAGRARSTSRRIVEMAPVDSVPVRCIQVDSPSHLYLAGTGMVATHNTSLASLVALYLAHADGEAAPETYFAAYDKDQAAICFDSARFMTERDPDLYAETVIYNSRREMILRENPGGFMRIVSKETGKLYGINLHGAIFDELMTQKNRELWDILTTSEGSREQPLIFAISTAGWDTNSVCFEQHELTRQIFEGNSKDPTFLGVVYGAHLDADWTDEDVWRNANPSLGDKDTGATVDINYYRRKFVKAHNQPTEQNAFRTLLLSQWVGQAERFLDMEAWDLGDRDIAPGYGLKAFGGLDLSATTDLTAYVVVSGRDKPEFVHPYIFLPQDNIIEREKRDRVPYRVWAKRGAITLTPGKTVNYESVKAAIADSALKFDLQDVSYDRWNATATVQELEDDGLELWQMGQGILQMSPPTKELLRLVVEGELAHGGHPVLRWCASNVAPRRDSSDNVKIDKERSAHRVDPMTALVMALDGWMRRGRPKKRSVYASDYGDEEAA